MKTIFKVFLLTAGLLLTSKAYSQLPVSFGIKAGVNLSNSSADTDDGEDKKAKVGFQVGVTAEYGITQEFFIQSGLFFTTKGVKVEEEYKEYDYRFKTTINQSYLQLPIMAAYKLEVVPATKIVFNAGPYLAYGIGGKIKAEGNLSGQKHSEKMDTFDDDTLKKFDFGVGFGVGAEFGKILVGLNYELGITDISQDKDFSYRNRNASLTVGYLF